MSVPLPGTLLAGRFRVDGEPIGAGRSGVVLPAVDEETGQVVALKLLHEHLATDSRALERLQAEAGIASRLANPRILKVKGLWSDQGRWLLVSERLDAVGLERAVEAAWAPAAVVAIGLELASALDAAHTAGVIHGDVRPGNVLVGPGCGAVLFDFSPGGARGEFGTSSLGGDDRLRPGETSPEVQAGAAPGRAADLYGLGVILYRALTGRMPFAGNTPWAVLGLQKKGPPKVPGPAGLSSLITALLDPDPTRRPRTAATVRQALLNVRARPDRRVRFNHRLLAPIRPRACFVVHGIDSATKAPALFAAGLSRRRSRDLVERLRAEGWEAQATREALSGGDLVAIGVASAVGGVVIPVLGAFLAAWFVSRELSARCRPDLRVALPVLRAAMPPRRIAPGTEYAVTAGLLLLIASFLLWLSPVWALIPLALVALVILAAISGRRRDLVREAAGARVETAVAECRRALEFRARPLDEALALQGELETVEREWHAGGDGDAVLARAEALLVRARDARSSEDDATRRALDALRRAQADGARGPR